MRTRKEIRKNLKARAKKILKRHYWLFLLLCIVSSILGGGSVLTSSGMNDPEADASLTTATSYSAVITSFLEFMVEITEDSVESQEQKIRETEARYV